MGQMNSERAKELATKALRMSRDCKELAKELDGARRFTIDRNERLEYTMAGARAHSAWWDLKSFARELASLYGIPFEDLEDSE